MNGLPGTNSGRVLPSLTSFYGNGETKFLNKLNGDWVLKQDWLQGAVRMFNQSRRDSFKFEKNRQPFICTHNETISVSMALCHVETVQQTAGGQKSNGDLNLARCPITASPHRWVPAVCCKRNFNPESSTLSTKKVLFDACVYNESLSVAAVCVSNPDRSPVGINRWDTTPTPTGFAEIVSDDFPGLHAMDSGRFFIHTAMTKCMKEMTGVHQRNREFLLAITSPFPLKAFWWLRR
jgi:hypothetical protein